MSECDLIRVSKIKRGEEPFGIAQATHYKHHSIGKNKEIYRKYGGILYVDLEALRALIENGGKANCNAATRPMTTCASDGAGNWT